MAISVLVTGQSGQLSRTLARAAHPAGWAIRCAGRHEFDLNATAAIADVVAAIDPDVIINAAAFTAVDLAEAEEARAARLNADAPTALARACAALDIALVHISTDYVFDGSKRGRYAESDARAPQNAYGRTKAQGEIGVLDSGANAAILRTSWVYSAGGSNFVRTMLKLAESRERIDVVHDQTGAPTWANDLADASIAAAQALLAGNAPARGVFHYSGAGEATWATFAEAIFAEARKRGWPSASVNRVTTDAFPRPAKRPINSLMDLASFEATFGLAPRPWREALHLCMDEIAQSAG
jgi:dTDP-4-dehydrorhamnose reductase